MNSKFKDIIWGYYRKHKRRLIWREHITPYNVFISEVMLQQTQVSRVEKKFPEFVKKFPNFKSLASASIKEVLQAWQGMGYNRRALYLKNAADIVVKKYKGIIPKNPDVLDDLPGIGGSTANSIIVFTYNLPLVFIETNIRRVFIHSFFTDSKNIDDKNILPLVEETLDKKNSREWYYALMDYGWHLSRITENPNKKSKQYKKQSQFKGSNREIRGAIIRTILKKPVTLSELGKNIQFERKKLYANLLELQKEGFIMEKKGIYHIK